MKKLLLQVVALWACSAGATSADVTFETYLQTLPSVEQLHASSNGNAVAWVRMFEGRRSIWIADGAELQARLLIEYPEDDGLPLSSLTVGPDGTSVAYIRGSWPNRQGETNNPHDAADPQERVLWMMKSGGGSPVRIAGGPGAALHAPAFSPDGRLLAYASGQEVWFAQVAVGSTERAFTIRGRVGALAWSPDGRSLAFVSQRNTHGFIGVFEVATRAIRYLAPGIDRDSNPVWSPDGRWLAFVRTREAVQEYRFTDRRIGIPWSIQAADAATWNVRTVWTAESGTGSQFIEFEQDGASGNGPEDNFASLLFTADNDLIFPWERTGSIHLYRVPVTGGQAHKVTEGEGEVSTASLSANGRLLVYQQNARIRERFDMFRMDASGRPSIFWEGAGPDTPAAPLADGRVAFIGETDKTPRQVMMQLPSKAKPRALDKLPDRFPTAAMAAPEVVTIVADDGFVSRALLFRPVQKRSQKRPALVWAHGGPRDITLPGVTKYDSRWIQSAVLAGYVVLASNYRGSIGYGNAHREVPGQGGGGGDDTRDVIAAGRWLANLPEVDARRIGIFGQSYGGYLTTNALARAPSVFAAGVSIVGVADWQMEMELDDGQPLPFRTSLRSQYEDRAFASSPNANLSQWRAPILFVNGDDDQSGWLAQSIQLGQSLRQRGIDVESWVEPGGTHGGVSQRHRLERTRRAIEFFDRYLENRR